MSHAPTTRSDVLGALLEPRDMPTALRVWSADGYVTHSHAEWHEGARRLAAGLRARGVEPGAPVAAILTNRFECCAIAPACWMAGNPLHSLPVLGRGQTLEDYALTLRAIVRDGHAAVVVAEGAIAILLEQAGLDCPVVALEDLVADRELEPQPLHLDDIAFVQYSSGSTSRPKGCALSLRAIEAHVSACGPAFGIGHGTSMVSWLPLSHDMGFFGALLPGFACGWESVIGTPERFVRSPRTWASDMARFGADITVGPNFALALLARAAGRGLDIAPGSLAGTHVVCGGERVQWSTILAVEEALGTAGMTRATLAPSYGMAEVTLCATTTPRGAGAHALWVDRDALVQRKLIHRSPDDERALALVACGVPIGETEIAIEGGADVGRILVRTPTRADGYLDRPQASAEAFPEPGLLVTADIGVLHEGELYVVGRTDDVIVHGGRNVHARDVEERAGKIVGVREGSVALLDEPGERTARLVMLAEASADDADLPDLARALSDCALRTAGARLDRCVFVARGTIPKTPSGKLQRHRARLVIADPGSALVAEVVLSLRDSIGSSLRELPGAVEVDR